jgi:hypothetical protein
MGAYYCIDNGCWQQYTLPFGIELDDVHLIEYFYLNKNGTQLPLFSASFKIDQTSRLIENFYSTKITLSK